MTQKPRQPRRTARDTAARVSNKLGLAYLRERIHAVFQPFLTAALDAAIGVRHVYERDARTGQWARVTDPDAITALLNAPHRGASETRLVVYTQDPDARLLEGLLAFQLGAPFDPELYPRLVQVEVNGDTGRLTVQVNEDFLAELRRPRARDRHGRSAAQRPPTPKAPRRVH
jgi:hypothetical protein